MCGIVGCYGAQGAWDMTLLNDMSTRLQHRGPNDADQWQGDGLGMAHQRLSILDLSPAGRQPIISQSGRWVLCYNGEVYNFKALRRTMEQRDWQSQCDAEVLVEAIDQWGIETAVKRFVGMFAFAVYDTIKQELWLVRDRLGIKPLYYGWVGKRFVFASELGPFSLFKENLRINRDSVSSYLRYGYIPTPHSIYTGVVKLPPGHMCKMVLGANSLTGSPGDLKQYWSYEDFALQPKLAISEQEATDQLHSLIQQAVADRLVADVPIGAFLSGGYDSSLVCAVMQEQMGRPVNTFTMGFEEAEVNEAHHAKKIAEHLGTVHTELYVSQNELLDAVEKLPALCDEPFGDSSILPTYLVSALAKSKVTVSLSGDGGDELFWGYTRYQRTLKLWQQVERVPTPLRRLLAESATNPTIQNLTRHLRVPGFVSKAGRLNLKLQRAAGIYGALSHAALYHQYISTWPYPNTLVNGECHSTAYNTPQHWSASLPAEQRMATQDLLHYLPDDILTKVDRASMAVSLEARVPLLDHRIVEFSAQLPDELKLQQQSSKYLLRRVLERYVPKQLTERPKMGFGVPMAQWLRGPLKPLAEDAFSKASLEQTDLLNYTPVNDLWQEHLQERRDNSDQLWYVLALQLWLKDQTAP